MEVKLWNACLFLPEPPATEELSHGSAPVELKEQETSAAESRGFFVCREWPTLHKEMAFQLLVSKTKRKVTLVILLEKSCTLMGMVMSEDHL